MGLLDNLGGLKGVMGQVEAAAVPMLISTVLAKTNMGDLQGLADKLAQGGLGPQVQSWIGDGKNLHVTPEQIKAALGNAQVQELARHFNLPIDEVLKLMAQYVPDAIDKASPNGTIQKS